MISQTSGKPRLGVSHATFSPRPSPPLLIPRWEVGQTELLPALAPDTGIAAEPSCIRSLNCNNFESKSVGAGVT